MHINTFAVLSDFQIKCIIFLLSDELLIIFVEIETKCIHIFITFNMRWYI